MKTKSIFHIVNLFLVFILACPFFVRSSAHAEDMKPGLSYSDYYVNFYENYNRLLSVDNGAPRNEKADESDGKGAKPSVDSILGRLHKGVGYTTLALGILSMGFGIAETVEYSRGNTPHRAMRYIHDFSSKGTIMFALGSVITGFVAYRDVFNFKNGINTVNSHALLGVIAASAIIASSVMGWVEGDDLRSKEGFSAHCGVAAGGGTLLMISIIVVQF